MVPCLHQDIHGKMFRPWWFNEYGMNVSVESYDFETRRFVLVRIDKVINEVKDRLTIALQPNTEGRNWLVGWEKQAARRSFSASVMMTTGLDEMCLAFGVVRSHLPKERLYGHKYTDLLGTNITCDWFVRHRRFLTIMPIVSEYFDVDAGFSLYRSKEITKIAYQIICPS
jgi:hypothetical protein